MSSFPDSATTQRLSTVRLELVSPRRIGTALHVTTLVVLIVLSAALALRLYSGSGAPAPRLNDLETRNAALDAELGRLRTELAMERATRSTLDAQVAELNERIAELRSQVDFQNAQRVRKRAANQ